MEHGGQGLEAIVLSFALSAIAMGILFVAAAFLGPYFPQARALLHPLNVLVLAGQVLDGATTWVGVGNPFGLDLPPYRETVFVSGLIIETFGGLAYFVLKVLLGVLVVLALTAALEIARRPAERYATQLARLTLIVIGAIPVYNNVANFLVAT